MNGYLYRPIRRNNIWHLLEVQENIPEKIYGLKSDRNGHEKTIKYKTRKITNLRICN